MRAGLQLRGARFLGTYHRDALHVVERWTIVSPDRIECEVTLEDPKVFMRPWKMAFPINRSKEKGYEIWEDSRHEGERDVEYILLGAGATRKPASQESTNIAEKRGDARPLNGILTVRRVTRAFHSSFTYINA